MHLGTYRRHGWRAENFVRANIRTSTRVCLAINFESQVDVVRIGLLATENEEVFFSAW